MPAMRFDLAVFYEDGQDVIVTADQRDIVMFEFAKKIGFANAVDAMPVTMWRYLAWAALKRTGKTGLTQDKWEPIVIAVEPVDSEDSDVNPGQPEASEQGSSNSPLRRANPSGKSARGSQKTSQPQ